MDQFYKYWFCGFQEALNQMDETDRNLFWKECGKACSDSYTKQVYLDAKNKSGNEEEFIDELKKAFPELAIEVLEKETSYLITYQFCACDLVKQNLINKPYLCECSRSSLQYNWETIYGEGNVQVELIRTILSGAPCCEFKISRRSLQ